LKANKHNLLCTDVVKTYLIWQKVTKTIFQYHWYYSNTHQPEPASHSKLKCMNSNSRENLTFV